jgi:SAM-dependent methyltransferase
MAKARNSPEPALAALSDPPPGVEQEIAEGDEMFTPGRRGLYFQLGAAALRSVRLALLAAGKGAPERILDFPCGHGRVLRMLKAEFPDAALTAGDLNADGVRFCERTFGATPVQSSLQPGDVTIEGQFDLIWCGSLLTHLDRDRWAGFFSLLVDAVEPGGVLVFTVYGLPRAEQIRTREALHGIGEHGAQKILAEFDRDGFGYADYEGQTLSGMSITSPSWVCEQIARTRSLRLVTYHECGWHGQQDVVAVTAKR